MSETLFRIIIPFIPYGIDFLIKKKQEDLQNCGHGEMTDNIIRQREELADQMKETPQIRMCCGKSDFLLDMNRRFYRKIRSRWDAAYSEGEGDHDFLYWNPRIPEVLSWIMKRMEACS